MRKYWADRRCKSKNKSEPTLEIAPPKECIRHPRHSAPDLATSKMIWLQIVCTFCPPSRYISPGPKGITLRPSLSNLPTCVSLPSGTPREAQKSDAAAESTKGQTDMQVRKRLEAASNCSAQAHGVKRGVGSIPI